MAETKMSVKLLAHTRLSDEFLKLEDYPDGSDFISVYDAFQCSDGQAVALTAIRTCYSANKPSEIVAKEGAKYFGTQATDGKGGSDADRLFRHIVGSGHTSTLEHISFTFAIEGISRALLAQLTRHRVGFSFSVQSQRYVRLGSNDRSGGFDYIIPDAVKECKKEFNYEKNDGEVVTANPVLFYKETMDTLQWIYDNLREMGIPAEDARAVLPNAAATNLVMTANLTALLSFYSKRRKGRGAQAEICELAEALRKTVTQVEPWTEQFFEQA
jgi:thymidylate synthase (FAD)